MLSIESTKRIFSSLCLLLAATLAASAATAKESVEESAKESAKESDEPLSLPIHRTLSFTVDEATWLSVDVAPDGTQLVIEVLGDLYLLPIEGGQAQPLSTGMAFDSQPVFSPDGTQIAFVSDRSGQDGLWLIDIDSGATRELTKGQARVDYASPEWSVDGDHVVVSRSSWALRTFELWAYHIDGGKGVQITKAKAKSDTPRNARHNALGAQYSPDGRYLYYAAKAGGFAYNQRFPTWQIARRDLTDGKQDVLTAAPGSAFRPQLSPDGKLLVYGTRYKQESGLRVMNIDTGEDRWLAYPVQRDEQESRFTRDLMPNYSFTPDGQSVVTSRAGKLIRVDVASGEVTPIPFSVAIEKAVAERSYVPPPGASPTEIKSVDTGEL